MIRLRLFVERQPAEAEGVPDTEDLFYLRYCIRLVKSALLTLHFRSAINETVTNKDPNSLAKAKTKTKVKFNRTYSVITRSRIDSDLRS